ncbi:MAG: 30S ribosomal protein S17 [Candidatus Omnitrophica bacterium]|nr:30S ribosomal protein S17 [Candidatus Omnitrophota bacterium]
MDNKRAKRKTRVGLVVSDKMDKTIVVKIERLTKHAQYGRVMRAASKFKVDDRENQAKTGDKVRIMETRPLSKEKRWRLIEVIK